MMKTGMILTLFSELIIFCDYKLPSSMRSISIAMCNYAERASYAVYVPQGTWTSRTLESRFQSPSIFDCCNDLAMIPSSEQ